jgi:hypothetical protein
MAEVATRPAMIESTESRYLIYQIIRFRRMLFKQERSMFFFVQLRSVMNIL